MDSRNEWCQQTIDTELLGTDLNPSVFVLT
jgi:hypothetical protein